MFCPKKNRPLTVRHALRFVQTNINLIKLKQPRAYKPLRRSDGLDPTLDETSTNEYIIYSKK